MRDEIRGIGRVGSGRVEETKKKRSRFFGNRTVYHLESDQPGPTRHASFFFSSLKYFFFFIYHENYKNKAERYINRVKVCN